MKTQLKDIIVVSVHSNNVVVLYGFGCKLGASNVLRQMP